MAKGVLEFNLPEENDAFVLAVDASNYYDALWDVAQHFRNALKYGELSEGDYSLTEALRDKLYEILEENEVVLNG